MIIGLDHVQIAAPAGSEEDARAFFGEVLGLEELRKPEELERRGGVWFACGALGLHVGVDPDFVPAKKAHPALLVFDLDHVRDALLEAGVSVKDDDSIPGTRRFHTADPWGNRLEFVEVQSV